MSVQTGIRHPIDWFSGKAIVFYLAIAKFVLHILTSNQYGYFRDELYYIAASKHLAFGYVDFPPLVAWLTALVRLLAGDSLVALRFPPALAGALLIMVAGMIAREMGGGRFAQVMSALAVLMAPVFMGTDINLTMDSFDQLAWAVSLLILVKLFKGGSPRGWILFGLVAGFALLAKLSILYLGFALVVGMLLTGQRSQFRHRELYWGGAIALAFLLPYVLWNAANGFPTLAFWMNYHNKVYSVTPITFLAQQILILNPVLFPLWVGGLLFLFRPKNAVWRPFGWIYLVLFFVLMVQSAKNYFLAPIYPLLFAAGSIGFERWTSGASRKWIQRTAIWVMVIGGLVVAPLTLPLAPMDLQIQYIRAMGGAAAPSEKEFTDIIPQHLGDRFGWPELADTVAAAYAGLPEADRSKACVFTDNYGEAGAIDFFGPARGLPPAISGHNNYFLWGPGSCTGEVLLYLGHETPEQLLQSFASVEQVGATQCTYCVWYENHLPLYLCRGLKQPMDVIWPQVKNIS
jgi:hypothetical protein